MKLYSKSPALLTKAIVTVTYVSAIKVENDVIQME
jgi:hypothetical protein